MLFFHIKIKSLLIVYQNFVQLLIFYKHFSSTTDEQDTSMKDVDADIDKVDEANVSPIDKNVEPKFG